MKYAVLALALASAASAETLSRATLDEFDKYMQVAREQMSGNPKFWVNQGTGRREEVLKGSITTGYYMGKEPRKVTDGLVHDWVGTIFIPRAHLDDGLKVLRDYNRHAEIYAPDVLASRLTATVNGKDRTSLRLLKRKAVVTVVLDTDFESELRVISPGKAIIAIQSLRIAEVNSPGAENESIARPDTGFGFLWRLNSWYMLEERPDGLWIELRSISLTRGIPAMLTSMIGPMVNTLPRESLTAALDKTRKAIQPLR